MMYEVIVTFGNGAIVRTWEKTKAKAEEFARRIADGALALDPGDASCSWTIREKEDRA